MSVKNQTAIDINAFSGRCDYVSDIIENFHPIIKLHSPLNRIDFENLWSLIELEPRGMVLHREKKTHKLVRPTSVQINPGKNKMKKM